MTYVAFQAALRDLEQLIKLQSGAGPDPKDRVRQLMEQDRDTI